VAGKEDAGGKQKWKEVALYPFVDSRLTFVAGQSKKL
jgi:hypothetical protein